MSFRLDILISVILILGFGVFIFLRIEKLIKQNLDYKKQSIDNTKMELMMNFDTEMAEKEIEDLIKNELNLYVVKHYISNKKNYLNDDDVKNIVKYLDRTLMLQLSELYIFYCKMLCNINDQDDLLRFIDEKVNDVTLDFVTNFNAPINPGSTMDILSY